MPGKIKTTLKYMACFKYHYMDIQKLIKLKVCKMPQPMPQIISKTINTLLPTAAEI